jgi:hypothetical protein
MVNPELPEFIDRRLPYCGKRRGSWCQHLMWPTGPPRQKSPKCTCSVCSSWSCWQGFPGLRGVCGGVDPGCSVLVRSLCSQARRRDKGKPTRHCSSSSFKHKGGTTEVPRTRGGDGKEGWVPQRPGCLGHRKPWPALTVTGLPMR